MNVDKAYGYGQSLFQYRRLRSLEPWTVYPYDESGAPKSSESAKSQESAPEGSPRTKTADQPGAPTRPNARNGRLSRYTEEQLQRPSKESPQVETEAASAERNAAKRRQQRVDSPLNIMMVPPDRMILRPDPVVMYLPVPGVAERAPRPLEHLLFEIDRCYRSQATPRHGRYERLPGLMERVDNEEVRRLCRILDPEHWQILFVDFCDALIDCDRERSRRVAQRDAKLDAGWYAAPWYIIDPHRFFTASDGRRADFRTALRGLEYIRDLGFDNVALSSHYASEAIPTMANAGLQYDTPAGDLGGEHGFQAFLERALELDLRVAVSDTMHTHIEHRDLDNPHAIGAVLHMIGHEVAQGVLGKTTWHVDEWWKDAPEKAHALHALIKLFLRLMSPREMLAEHVTARSEESFTFGGVDSSIHGVPTSSEADLVEWAECGQGIRDALLLGTKTFLERTISRRPSLPHTTRPMVTLDDSDLVVLAQSGDPEQMRKIIAQAGGWLSDDGEHGQFRLADCLDRDPRRIALALFLLYSVPAVPEVYFGLEIGARGAMRNHRGQRTFDHGRVTEGALQAAVESDHRGLRTLKQLNDFWRKYPSMRTSDVHFESGPDHLVRWRKGDLQIYANLRSDVAVVPSPNSSLLLISDGVTEDARGLVLPPWGFAVA